MYRTKNTNKVYEYKIENHKKYINYNKENREKDINVILYNLYLDRLKSNINHNKISYLLNICPEIMNLIINQLSTADIVRLILTCKYFGYLKYNDNIIIGKYVYYIALHTWITHVTPLSITNKFHKI